MLFRKNIARSCALCRYAQPVNATDMLCSKCGAVRARYACRRFRYDPTKRMPEAKLKPENLLDFNIEP